MEDLKFWLPIAMTIIVNVVTIVWSWAKLDKKIDVSDVKTEGKICTINTLMAEKFTNIEGKITSKFNELECQVGEIKNNHLHELKSDIRFLNEKITKHIELSK